MKIYKLVNKPYAVQAALTRTGFMGYNKRSHVGSIEICKGDIMLACNTGEGIFIFNNVKSIMFSTDVIPKVIFNAPYPVGDAWKYTIENYNSVNHGIAKIIY